MPISSARKPQTLVIQSHRKPLPHTWLAPCIASVKNWAKGQAFDYRFIGDEIFDALPPWVIKKTRTQKIIATDLARLKCLQHFLAVDYERVVWLDADFLIFAPGSFQLPKPEQLPEHYALGREIWVQPKNAEPSRHQVSSIKFKAYTKVHNAFLLFSRGNNFLDFYTAHAERLLARVSNYYQGGPTPIPPQFIGPKLLTALHNIIQCPVQENAGMLSPWVINDVLSGGGPALDLFREKSSQPPAGVNLCSSLSNSDLLQECNLETLVTQLLSQAHI